MVRTGRHPVLGPIAEHPREGTVDGVARTRPRGMDADPDVRSRRPELAAARVHGVGLRLEVTHLGERQRQAPASVGPTLHRQVPPCRTSQRELLEMGTDNLVPDADRPSDIGPQPRGPALRQGLPFAAEDDGQEIAGVPHGAVAGFGRHLETGHGTGIGLDGRVERARRQSVSYAAGRATDNRPESKDSTTALPMTSNDVRPSPCGPRSSVRSGPPTHPTATPPSPAPHHGRHAGRT